MKQRIGIIAAVIAVGLGLGQGVLGARTQRTNGSPSAAVQANSAHRKTIYTSQSSTILQGVVAPLNSLRLMKRDRHIVGRQHQHYSTPRYFERAA